MPVYQQVQQLIQQYSSQSQKFTVALSITGGNGTTIGGACKDLKLTLRQLRSRSHFLGAAQSVPSALIWYPVGERQFSQETEEMYNTIISSLRNPWNCQTVGGKVSSSKFSVTRPHDNHAATTAQEGIFRGEFRTGLFRASYICKFDTFQEQIGNNTT